MLEYVANRCTESLAVIFVFTYSNPTDEHYKVFHRGVDKDKVYLKKGKKAKILFKDYFKFKEVKKYVNLTKAEVI